MDAEYWLIVFIVLVVIELATMSLTTIWFAGGSLVAFAASLLGAGLGVQLVLFFVLSFAILFLTRPLAVKHLNRSRTKTNVDAMVGKTGIVVDEINNTLATGSVSIQGMEWMARSEDDIKSIPRDKVVEVLKITGAKVIVKERIEEA